MTTTPVSTTASRRDRWAWYLYDFGNSAYAAVVLLAVFSAYFQGEVVGGAEGTRLWGIAVGVAMLIVAVTAPILGAIADFSGSKKRFLVFYTVMAIIFTGALFFSEAGRVVLSMLFFILAEVGYRSAQVFYNGFLTEIAEPDEIGRVSGNGWAIGTAGGVICLLLILPLIVIIGGSFIVRLSLVITAIFFALSALPLFLWLPERAKKRPLPEGENYLSLAFKQLRNTIRTAGSFREFVKFMLAFLVYNDGVMMALDFAAILGAVLFGIDQQGLIVFVILVQITNVIGALIFGILVDRFGGKRSLIGAISLMIVVVIILYFSRTATGFYIVGAMAGFAMAGIQSVSRTMVGMFSPPGKSAEFYGFFALTGRTSSFVGPAVFGILAAEATLWYMAQGQAMEAAEQSGHRIAVLSIALFLVLGMIVLLFVNEDKARQAATQSPSLDQEVG
ncbi:MAG: MFS transporter [Candidatus Promineifilaceae bacterium]|nr:MFS transporter [Candidatus Promineifilaceae bacterium]